MSEEPVSPPALLVKTHDISAFDCGKPPLNDFLVRYALQNQASGGARTYVLTRGNRVIGYYSLAPASVSPEEVSARLTSIVAPYATVLPSDRWMPQGFDQTDEATLPEAERLLTPEVRLELRRWWLTA